jgi:citrate synthase
MPLVLSVASLADPQRTDGRPDTLIARGRMMIPLLAACLAPELSAATVTRALTASSVAAVAARALGLDDEAAPIVDTILVLLADHELNASSFAARVAASTGADPYACIAAALATVSGPLHGSASEMLARLADDIGAPENVPAALAAMRKRGESPPAFGHPLYPMGDPRTLPLLALARDLVARSSSPRAAHGDGLRSARSPRGVAAAAAAGPGRGASPETESTNRSDGIRRARTLLAIVDTLAAHAARSRVSTKRASDPRPIPAAALPSVDVGLAAVVAALGLPASSASGLFALARSAGWLAHALEQRAAGFLLRPRARYVGMPIAS